MIFAKWRIDKMPSAIAYSAWVYGVYHGMTTSAAIKIFKRYGLNQYLIDNAGYVGYGRDGLSMCEILREELSKRGFESPPMVYDTILVSLPDTLYT